MKRSELKAIIKECLMEILRDGFGETLEEGMLKQRQRQQMIESQQQRPQTRQNVQPARLPEQRSKHPVLDAPARHVEQINSITSDPIMSGIFADTAQTTLRTQGAHGHSGPSREGGGAVHADTAAAIVAAHEPDQLFENTDRWAKLAFADVKPQ